MHTVLQARALSQVLNLKARATLKETLIHDACLGNLKLLVKHKAAANAYNLEVWCMKTQWQWAVVHAVLPALRARLSAALHAVPYTQARTVFLMRCALSWGRINT